MALVAAFPEQHPSFSALLEHLRQQLGVGLLGDLVLHELDSQQHALASHVADELALLPDPLELSKQVAADLLSVLGQFLLADDVEHLHADSALQGSSCESREVVVAERVCDFSSGGNCGEGRAIGDGLSHDDNIRLDFLPLEAPLLFADPPEAGLHLI